MWMGALLLGCSLWPELSWHSGETGTRESVCDGLDDDDDGLVDEGALIAVIELSEDSYELVDHPSLERIPKDREDLLPGVRTLTWRFYMPSSSTNPNPRPSTWERVFDTQGRQVSDWDENFVHADDGYRSYRYSETVWGLYGEEHWRWDIETRSLTSDYVLTHTFQQRDTEYDDNGQRVFLQEQAGDSLSTTEFEYDAQGRLTLTITNDSLGCIQHRQDWDDLAYTMTRWEDEGCTGDWVVDTGIQYDALWQPLSDLDGEVYLTWEDGQLLTWEQDGHHLENVYVDGRLERSVHTRDGSLYKESWVDYAQDGSILQHSVLRDGGLDQDTYSYNALGGLEQNERWLEDSDSTRTWTYVSDAENNLSELHDGDGYRYEYSFDCHPPQ